MLTLAAMVFPLVVICNGAEVTLDEIVETHDDTVMVRYTAFRGEVQVNQMNMRPQTVEQWAENQESARIYVVERYKQVACL